MAQTKNSAVVKSNRLFSGIYDISFNFKDKNLFDVKEGEVIYSRGDKSEYMYLLISGRVKFKTYENPRQPKVFLVGKNDFFGEKELIDKVSRNSSAVAEKDSTLFRVSHKDFIKISGSNRKIFDNLKEQNYEEVVAPSKRTELKEDIFKRILNETEVPVKKETGIELRDYSYENPLLEMKARDEITEELKMYSDDDNSDLILTDDDIIIDDDGVTWEFDEGDKKEKDEIEGKTETAELKQEEIPDEVEEEPGETQESLNLPDEIETEGDILDNFLKIREQVNDFRESLQDEDLQFEEPQPVEPFVIKPSVPDQGFVSAVEKIISGLEKEETDNLIVQACTELVNAERGILYFPDSSLFLKGRLSEEGTELTAAEDTIPGKCLTDRKLINIKDVFNDPDFNPSLDYISYFHIHSLICLPITDGENVKAVLELFNSRNGEFSENDELQLGNICPVILRSIERYERYEKAAGLLKKELTERIKEEEAEKLLLESLAAPMNGHDEHEMPITEVFEEEDKKATKESKVDKQVSLRVLSEFLLQEFQAIIRDIKQFNAYLQRIDIPGETKEISEIVTNQSIKIIDLIEALKGYSESRKIISEEKQSYVSVFDNLVNLLAEYTEGRKVNLYKRFDADAEIMADPKYLYLAVFQIIKYECDLMPFGGNIFISSVVSEDAIEILIRNATKKTDESLVISAPLEYNEDTPSGVGLSLAKRIIEDHNASMEVKNQSGTGLEVAIRFVMV